MPEKDIKGVVNFLFEAGVLQRTPRTGFFYLGSGKQSVAEHMNRVAYVGYALAKMNGQVDVGKVLQMCMFHDFAEARTTDLNYVHQKYNVQDEKQAIEDFTENLPFGEDIKKVVEEYEERESLESILVKDADNLELLLSLKEVADWGNKHALDWIPFTLKRIKTPEAQELANTIINTPYDAWWFSEQDKKDDWWVTRHKDAK